ncbi:MAG: magnesium/cobalt transporter CorA [Methylococcales bacterium]|nr:magnesium/cobalt transporter CorA [Methylococcales bacterium]
MIMNCVAYQKGIRLGEVTLDDISEVIKQEGTFVWLGLLNPDSALIKKIQEEFSLHELAIEDTLSAHQRPKLEEYGDSLFVVLHSAVLTQNSVEFGETHIFVGKQFLVSVRRGTTPSYQKVRSRCEAMPHQLAKGSSFALYGIMDYIVDNYVPVIDGLQARFEEIETAIFQYHPSRHTMEDLYALKRELLLLKNATLPLIDISNELMRFHNDIIHPDIGVYFRDISDHLKRVTQEIDAIREMLISAMQVHLTFETIRQNEVVKRLSGWGAILAIPTLVCSWYGMNFKHMPELEGEFSYPVLIGTIFVSCGLLYRRLKRVGWL